MKVCQLCAVDFTVEHFLTPLIHRMENENWKVHCVCSYGNYSEKLKKDGHHMININIPRSLNVFSILFAIFQLYKLFKKENYNMVHVHTPIASFIGRIAAKLSGIKCIIYTAHGFYFHENMSVLKFFIYLNIEKFLSKFTNIIFTQSLEDKKIAVEKKFLKKNLIYNIGNGVDSNLFNPKKYRHIYNIKKNLNIPKDSTVVGCIARLVKEKGIVEFLGAAIQISKKFSNVYFVLVGERLESDHNTNIEKHITDAKKFMNSKLVLTGYRTDIPELISIMDLYCLPSWREGMSRSIIEAMMMEKPILTTNIRGCREQVDHQITGLIVPIKSQEKLFCSMKYLIMNKKIRIKFGKLGRKKALKLYEEKNILELQMKIIKKYI